MHIIPDNQLFGGKICAALDRQHPRDIFDIKYLLEGDGISDEIKQGFMFCLLSSSRPIHEMLNPSLIDQQDAFENHFKGRTKELFTYEDFDKTREKLISNIRKILTDVDKQFLISFKSGNPDWNLDSFKKFKNYPAIKWKLQNVNNLKENSPERHKQQLDNLKQVLEQDVS
jgi:hypothetical protein